MLPRKRVSLLNSLNPKNNIRQSRQLIKNATTGFEVKHWGLNKRARNEIELTIPSNISVSNLSISVTDAMVETDSSTHIASELLLSTELKGYIHNPSYYFTDTSAKRIHHLDLVMLTHGWRRFKWENVFSHQRVCSSFRGFKITLIFSIRFLFISKGTNV